MPSLAALWSRLVERSPFRPVTRDDQRTWFFLAAIQIGVTICVPLFALGGDLGRHVRFVDLIPAVIAGSVITAFFATLTGLVGMKVRVPTAVLMRRAFGELGGRAVAFILVITLFGWFGVQTEVLVQSIGTLLASNMDVEVSPLLLTFVCGALMSTTAIIGFRALGKIAYVAVPLLLAVIAVPTVIALTTHDVVPLLTAPPAEAPYTFGLVVSIISGGHMVAVTIAPDLARFLRSSRDTVVGMIVSFCVALPILLLISSMLAVIYGSGNLIAILVAAGVGAPALLVIVLATWTSNDKNLYESALSLSTLFPKVERWLLTACAGVIGTTLAAIGIFAHFIELLIFLGITIAPVAGVYLVDFQLHRAAYMSQEPGARVRWTSFAAWALGIGFGLMTLPRGSHGFGWITLTSIPTLDALLAAGAAQWALTGLKRGARRTVEAPQADAR
jgi:cytosine permease